MDGTDLRNILSLAKQLVFVHNFGPKPASGVQKEIDDKGDSWDIERGLTTKGVALSSLFGRLGEAQHVCEKGRDVVPRTFVEMIKLAREDVEAKRKNGTVFNRNMDTTAKLVGAHTVRGTIHE